MMLNGKLLKDKNLIEGASEKNYRYASYDVRIGRIIDSKGKEVAETNLEPQGMLRVISKESLKLSPDVAGYAMIKTSLCDEGILAINIGILDPGYEGLLSSTLINFGKHACPFKLGDVFLRLTFHPITPPDDFDPKPADSEEDYVAAKKKLVLRDFSDTFLNVEETATRAAQRVVGKWTARAIVWASVIALIFVAIAALSTAFGAMMATRKDINSDQQQLKNEIIYLQNAVRLLQNQRRNTPPARKPLAQQR